MKSSPGRRPTSSGDGGAAMDVRRDEFASVTDALQNVNNVTRDEFRAATKDIQEAIRNFQTQFTRIAQIQNELDDVRRTLAKLTAAVEARGSGRSR